jgi:hypothetical protein
LNSTVGSDISLYEKEVHKTPTNKSIEIFPEKSALNETLVIGTCIDGL